MARLIALSGVRLFIRSSALLGICFMCPGWACPGQIQPPKFVVRVDDRGSTDARSLSSAQGQVSRVFERAGIELEWVAFIRPHDSDMQLPSCTPEQRTAFMELLLLPRDKLHGQVLLP